MSEHRAEALARIHRAHGATLPSSTLRFHRGEIETVICRDCGTPIRGLVDDDRFDESKMIGGQQTLIRRQTFMTLPSYTEATMHFDDGSKHVTIGCRACLDKIAPQTLERQYTADLLDWMRQEDAGKGSVDWFHVAYRKPLSIEVSPP